jgi:hypothetical protein
MKGLLSFSVLLVLMVLASTVSCRSLKSYKREYLVGDQEQEGSSWGDAIDDTEDEGDGNDSMPEWLNMHFEDLSQDDQDDGGDDSSLEAVEATNSTGYSFQPIPLPDKFAEYDVLERDGVITMEELVYVTGAVENARAAFKASDLNDDGVVDVQEFRKAPWYRKNSFDFSNFQ